MFFINNNQASWGRKQRTGKVSGKPSIKTGAILSSSMLLTSTPSISSFSNYLEPSDLLIMMLSAVKLIKRSLNASAISRSECLLKFSLLSS